MMRTFVLRGEPQAQNLWAFLKANWQALAQAGKPLAVTVTEYKTTRSIEQNKRYWSILNIIADFAWVNGVQFSAEAWHEYFKRKYIGHVDLPNGGTVGISTTSLSVAEFGDYMLLVERCAAEELGVEVTI